MEREARMKYEAQAFKNKTIARQQNVSIAEGFIHVSKGKRFYIKGVGQRKGGQSGRGR